tara:strand:- start:84 stop:455 length:372 start_codon:yes stop_codon:yes gene_type:complete
MNLEIIFKRLILADLIVLIIAFITGMFSVPAEEVPPFSSIDVIFLAVLLAYLFNLYLLYKFKSLGKKMYIPLFALTIGLTFAYPLEYINPHNYLEYILISVGPAISGAIITMLYFTNISQKFD